MTLERAQLGLLAALAATIPVSIFASQVPRFDRLARRPGQVSPGSEGSGSGADPGSPAATGGRS